MAIKIYVDWDSERILTEKQYQKKREKLRSATDDCDFLYWLNNNYSSADIFQIMTEPDGMMRLTSLFATETMNDTYEEIFLEDDDDEPLESGQLFPDPPEDDEEL